MLDRRQFVWGAARSGGIGLRSFETGGFSMEISGRIIPTRTQRPVGLDPKRFNAFITVVCRGGFCNPTLAASRSNHVHTW